VDERDRHYLETLGTQLDISQPHPARRYNYLLGGKDNFAADRASADAIAELYPAVRTTAMENRMFLRRAAQMMVGFGVRQFLDIGTGVPGPDNTHTVTQAIDPSCRVVYVDNDPMVLAHARALLNSSPAGVTAYVDADVRDPVGILNNPGTREVIDFDKPVGLLIIAVLHFIEDEADPWGIVAQLCGALPPGSYLALSHATSDLIPPELVAQGTSLKPQDRVHSRTLAQTQRFFEGLELVEPGVVPVSRWNDEAENRTRPPDADVAVYGALAKIT